MSVESEVRDAAGVPVAVNFSPKRHAGIPFLIGGVKRASIVRAAAIGDGWMPGYADAELSLPDFRQRYYELCRLLDSSDRPRSAVPVVVKLQMKLDKTSPPRPDDELITIDKYRKAGADEIIIDVAGAPSTSYSLGLIDWIQRAVVPRFGAP
jgi:hypothetical protein